MTAELISNYLVGDLGRGMATTKTALVLIEFQREWLDPEIGKLYGLIDDREQFAAAQAGAEEALVRARAEERCLVVHVPCLFRPGYPEAGTHPAGLFSAIPQSGTWTDAGRDFAVPFLPLPDEYVVAGRVGASAFAHSDLDIYLRQQGVTEVLLAGFALHVCVESTLRAAHDLGYDATVLLDASSSFTAAQRDYFLTEVVHHFGRHSTVREALPSTVDT